MADSHRASKNQIGIYNHSMGICQFLFVPLIKNAAELTATTTLAFTRTGEETPVFISIEDKTNVVTGVLACQPE